MQDSSLFKRILIACEPTAKEAEFPYLQKHFFVTKGRNTLYFGTQRPQICVHAPNNTDPKWDAFSFFFPYSMCQIPIKLDPHNPQVKDTILKLRVESVTPQGQ